MIQVKPAHHHRLKLIYSCSAAWGRHNAWRTWQGRLSASEGNKSRDTKETITRTQKARVASNPDLTKFFSCLGIFLLLTSVSFPSCVSPNFCSSDCIPKMRSGIKVFPAIIHRGGFCAVGIKRKHSKAPTGR